MLLSIIMPFMRKSFFLQYINKYTLITFGECTGDLQLFFYNHKTSPFAGDSFFFHILWYALRCDIVALQNRCMVALLPALEIDVTQWFSHLTNICKAVPYRKNKIIFCHFSWAKLTRNAVLKWVIPLFSY